MNRIIAMVGLAVQLTVCATADTVLHMSLPPGPVTHAWRSAETQVTESAPIDPGTAALSREIGRFAPDTVIPPIAERPSGAYVWRVLLLIYPSIDTDQTVSGVTTHFAYTLTAAEIAETQQAIASAQTGIQDGSGQEARICLTQIIVGRTLTTLAKFGADIYWPDCSITAPELLTYGQGVADSVIVYWPARNPGSGAQVNNPYWGLSYGAPASWTYNVGYSTVSNLVSPVYPGYYPGEVMIHEWLHPTSDYYHTVKGYTVPNLDGASSYRPCPTCANYAYVDSDGWMSFYRDFMTGSVWNPSTSAYIGLPAAAWQSGTPLNILAHAWTWQLYE